MQTLSRVFLIGALMMAPAVVSAHTEDDPLATDLIAGGGNPKSAMDVGEVLTWNDADTLYVTYVVTAPWCITETHVQAAASLDDIPQKNGNPIPGRFAYKARHDCRQDVTVPVGLAWPPGTMLYVAAHALVARQVIIGGVPAILSETAWGAGADFPGSNWATYFTYTVQSPPMPAIDIEKLTNGEDADTPPGPSVSVGGAVLWEYVVTNSGNVGLSNVVVSDDQLGTVCTIPSLAPGDSVTCSRTGTAVAGQYANLGTVTGTDPYGTVVMDQDPSHYLGQPPTGSIGDLVWHDVNRNGIQDAGEPGLGMVQIDLKDSTGFVIASATTDATGFYQFMGLQAGGYSLEAATPAGYAPTVPNVGGDPTKDSNGSPAMVTLPTDDASDQHVDFGFIQVP